MVTGTVNDVYSDVVGTGKGYNFNNGSSTTPQFYVLDKTLKDELNLSESTYVLSDHTTTTLTVTAGTPSTLTVGGSFVAFNGTSVVVCLAARQSGSYYVANYASNSKTATVFGVKVSFDNSLDATPTGSKTNKIMWACNTDGINSWT